jgi:hypothetical protein
MTDIAIASTLDLSEEMDHLGTILFDYSTRMNRIQC